MESMITLCYGLTVLLGVAALSIQLLLKQKDMLVADRGIKETSTSIFFGMIVVLNIIDFLYYYFWQIQLYRHAENMLIVDDVLWTLLAYYFIEFERKFARQPKKKTPIGIVFFIIMAANLLIDLSDLSDKVYYTIYVILASVVWILISVNGIRYTINIFQRSPGINRVVILLYDAVFLFECIEDTFISLYYRNGGSYMIEEEFLTILIWLVLSSTNLYFVWKSCRTDKTSADDLALAAKRYGFSESEHAVAALLLEGKSNQQIADELQMSESAVKVHNHRLYKKLEVENRVQAVNRLRNP